MVTFFLGLCECSEAISQTLNEKELAILPLPKCVRFFFLLLQVEVNANNVPIEGLSIQHPQVRAVCGSGCDLS